MSWAAGWRTAARIARREVRRRPGRSALVVVLIGLPVAGVTFWNIMDRSATPTVDEYAAWTLGRADDLVHQAGDTGEPAVDPPHFARTVQAAYPPGTRVVAFTEGQDAFTDAEGHLHQIDYTNQPFDEPLLEGTRALRDGRAPRAADEVVASSALLDRLDAEVGDDIELLLLGEVTVTGVVRDPSCLRCELVVGTAPARDVGRMNVAFVEAPRPLSSTGVQRLAQIHASSLTAQSGGIRDELETMAPRPGTLEPYIWGGLVLAAAAVIVTAAFAVSARRQLRTLGLLSASGVSPQGLRRTLLLQGATTGLVGSAIGVVAGVAAAAAARPFANSFTQHHVDSLVVHPLDLIGPMALGVTAATAAAWLPAQTAARLPVLAALAGRKPQTRVRLWLPLAGGVAVVTGLISLVARVQYLGLPYTGLGLGGGLAVLLGGVALAPWLVQWGEHLARRLRGAARIALRDLSRQRVRSAAVVAAVMAPAWLAVVAATYTFGSGDGAPEPASNPFDYAGLENQVLVQAADPTTREDFDQHLEPVREVLREATEVGVGITALPSDGSAPGSATVRIADRLNPLLDETRYIVVNEPADLAAVGLPAEIVEAVAAGKVLVFDAPFPLSPDAHMALDWSGAVIEPDDVVRTQFRVPHGEMVVAVSPATAERWGLRTSYLGTLFVNPDPLTERQRKDVQLAYSPCDFWTPECRDQEVRDALLGTPAPTPGISVEVFGPVQNDPVPRSSDDALEVQLAGAGISLLVTLVVVAVALALTTAESRDERALLEAVGAPPQVRRSISVWQAGFLPALAMAIALPSGLAAGLAVSSGGSFQDFPRHTPWLTVVLLGLGIPLISAGMAWLAASLTGRQRRDLSALALAAD